MYALLVALANESVTLVRTWVPRTGLRMWRDARNNETLRFSTARRGTARVSVRPSRLVPASGVGTGQRELSIRVAGEEFEILLLQAAREGCYVWNVSLE